MEFLNEETLQEKTSDEIIKLLSRKILNLEEALRHSNALRQENMKEIKALRLQNQKLIAAQKEMKFKHKCNLEKEQINKKFWLEQIEDLKSVEKQNAIINVNVEENNKQKSSDLSSSESSQLNNDEVRQLINKLRKQLYEKGSSLNSLKSINISLSKQNVSLLDRLRR